MLCGPSHRSPPCLFPSTKPLSVTRRNFTAGAEGWENTWVNFYEPFVREYGDGTRPYLTKGERVPAAGTPPACQMQGAARLRALVQRFGARVRRRSGQGARLARSPPAASRRPTACRPRCNAPTHHLPAEEAETVSRYWLYLAGDYW